MLFRSIGIADADKVDLSNLQRQIIHATNDVGKLKADSAKESMLAINPPDIKVIAHHELVNSKNILELIQGYDFILDGTDNFPAKFLINDASVQTGRSDRSYSRSNRLPPSTGSGEIHHWRRATVDGKPLNV